VNNSVFGIESLHRLCKLSKYAYPPKARDDEKGQPLQSYVVQKDEIAKVGAELLSVFEDKVNSVECYCVRIILTVGGITRSTIVYTYRGTHGLRDLGTDILADMVKTSYGRVHLGFRRYYQISREWVLDTLRDIRYDYSEPVIANGHSLGGGGAANCALENGFFLSTFGCPTIGDAESNVRIEELPGAVRCWQTFDRVAYAPSHWTNRILETNYDWGPWKGCGQWVGFGRHAISGYEQKLAKRLSKIQFKRLRKLKGK